MSSSSVRTAIKTFIGTNVPTEKLIDLTAEFQYLNELLEGKSATGLPWLGIQFIGNTEEPVSLTAGNNTGKYLETGAFYLHVVDVAYLGVSDIILTRAETLRDLFRGMRIGDITIDSMTPPNFGEGATISFESGYTGASILVSYERRFDL